MTSLWFQTFLLPEGWADRVRIDIAAGRVHAIQIGDAPGPNAERHAIGLPGLPNVHSHAFQRGIAGLTEFRAAAGDSFWTWRETMYRFVEVIGRDDVEALAAFAYMEMLEAGFTPRVSFITCTTTAAAALFPIPPRWRAGSQPPHRRSESA